MTRTYYRYFIILILALCLTGSVLKLRVIWQPSTLSVKPTAMSWIIDTRENRKDFMPSEEGFIEFVKRRIKRDSGNSEENTDELVTSGFYNLEEISVSSNSPPTTTLALQVAEDYSGSGSGVPLVSSGDYSGSGEHLIAPSDQNFPHNFIEGSGSGDGAYDTSIFGSGTTLREFQFDNETSDSGTHLVQTTQALSDFHPSDKFQTSTPVTESSSSQPAIGGLTNSTEEVVSSTSEAFTVRSDFQESRTHSGNDVITTEMAEEEVFTCLSASQCDEHLNERCIEQGSYTVCGCGRSFIRDPVTKRCEAKVSLVGRLRCPNETYNLELGDHGSLEYRQTEIKVKEALFIVFKSCNCLPLQGSDLQLIGLYSGSLLIDWQLIFPASGHRSSLNQLANSVRENIAVTLQTQQPSLNEAPINLNGAEVVYVSSDGNPCDDPKRNYCSPKAKCLKSNISEEGYICVCNKGYLDTSPYVQRYPGEMCQELCFEEYCGRNGDCSVVNNEAICRCNAWYSGRNCKISIAVLAATIGCVVILMSAIVITFGRFYYKKRKGTFGTFKLKIPSTSKPKLQEEIALSMSKHIETT